MPFKRSAMALALCLALATTGVPAADGASADATGSPTATAAQKEKKRSKRGKRRTGKPGTSKPTKCSNTSKPYLIGGYCMGLSFGDAKSRITIAKLSGGRGYELSYQGLGSIAASCTSAEGVVRPYDSGYGNGNEYAKLKGTSFSATFEHPGSKVELAGRITGSNKVTITRWHRRFTQDFGSVCELGVENVKVG